MLLRVPTAKCIPKQPRQDSDSEQEQRWVDTVQCTDPDSWMGRSGGVGWDRTVGGWDSRTLGSAGRPFKDSNYLGVRCVASLRMDHHLYVLFLLLNEVGSATLDVLGKTDNGPRAIRRCRVAGRGEEDKTRPPSTDDSDPSIRALTGQRHLVLYLM
ncbi:uncharacterized protein H6S33_007735 [Morchella sextelata]|uniref:uncharacterized protein n=1 Tax=Morchella sextelata TaxID=1174677 RepID=UPI001D04268D|nr:uncharacterized protein H6S33_007735 [Morchella sextelata]KAH0603413.1 hypothetical protein H6S33_007735 [Morchella sextelata]